LAKSPSLGELNPARVVLVTKMEQKLRLPLERLGRLRMLRINGGDMKRACSVVLLLVSLAFAADAFADALTCLSTVTSGSFTAQFCNDFSGVSGHAAILITGPEETKEYEFLNGPSFVGASLSLNDLGELAGYSDWGTDDPALFYAAYSGGIDVGGVEAVALNDPCGTSLFGSTTPPPGVITTDFGTLGIPILPFDPSLSQEFCYPDRPTINDAGVITETVYYYNIPNAGPVTYEWQFASNVPEPSSLTLLGSSICVLAAVAARRRRNRAGVITLVTVAIGVVSLTGSAHGDSFGSTSSTFAQICLSGTCYQRSGPGQDWLFTPGNMDPTYPSYAIAEWGGIHFSSLNLDYSFAGARLHSEGPVTGIERDTASIFSELQWWDTIHVTSDTLSLGTPVDLQFTLMLDAEGNIIAYANGTNSSLFEPLVAGAGSLSFAGPNANAEEEVQYLTVQTTVGSAFEITGDMTSSTFLNPLVGGEDASSSFSSSQQVYIDSNTAGVSITSDSGRDYQTPVPEPSSLVSFGVGLVCLVAALKK